MAKEVKPKQPKTKRSTFDTLCTEIEKGEWQWEAAGMTWVWEKKMTGGLNCYVAGADKEEKPVAFFKTLEIAVGYSMGFEAGMESAKDAQEKKEEAVRLSQPLEQANPE
jgi:hypothetical protein